MIQPTIGRVVWFWPAGDRPDQPWAAIVTYVHSDTEVNLRVWEPNGMAWGEASVPLYQGEGEPPESRFCQWMPYQKGQAVKTEALEKQAKEWTAPELKKVAVDELTSGFGEDDPS